MKKRTKHKKEFVAAPQTEQGVVDILNRIQQQLVFLEKKINTLIAGSSSRPSEVRPFQKPFQRHDYSHSSSQARPDNDFRDRVLHKAVCADCRKECEVPFKPSGERPVYCKECFSKRKAGDSFKERPDNRPRGDSRGQERHFDRKPRPEHRGYDGKKKPIFRKRRAK
jgi:CxxC-x17-CxxC domain-containing protein